MVKLSLISILLPSASKDFTLSKEESINPIYKEIQNKIKAINPNNDTISQEDYFAALSKLKFDVLVPTTDTLVDADSSLNNKTDIQTASLPSDKLT